MTTETKPTPATDEEVSSGYAEFPCDCDYGEHKPRRTHCMSVFGPRLLARIEADRAKILPSSCSLSHPEIRYTGDRCPLCEALYGLETARLAISIAPDDTWGKANDGRVDEWGDLENEWPISREILSKINAAIAAAKTKATLSRPSSAPGAKPVELAEEIACIKLRKPAPGDGEVKS